jgi:5-methylcytosine-specific restriction protein A
MRFCPEPGCGAIVPNGERCEAHRSKAAIGNTYAAVVHRWYCSKRWKSLRDDVLREQPFCRECAKQGRRILTAEVDHINRHAGDPYLFWNRANLQGLCKSCHSKKTQDGK